MTKQSFRLSLVLAAAFAFVAGAFSPSLADKAGSEIFTGIVIHVSTNNIKVQNPKTKESLSFLLVPHFNQVFSSDGKTTAQMSAIKPGGYVKIYYDQKAFGVKHADRILVLNQANQPVMKTGS
jgi:hypothetical protein